MSQEGFQADPVEQFFLWEQTANIEQFRMPTDRIDIPVRYVDPSKVEVMLDPHAPDYIKDYLFRDGKVAMPNHPRNTNTVAAPWQNLPKEGDWHGRYTASRSMGVLVDTDVFFTIKMPSNRVGKEEQDTKVKLRNDVEISMDRGRLITEVDAHFGAKPDTIFLREAASVTWNENGNGYLIRDMSELLKRGTYWIPAMSLPYVIFSIAAANLNPNEDVETAAKRLLTEFYAKRLGAGKAEMLMRYGIQMSTPNPQNMLIGIDANLRFTGDLAFRDLPDTRFVSSVVNLLNSPVVTRHYEHARMRGWTIDRAIRPYWGNSSWRLEQADPRLPYSFWNGLEQDHDRAYGRKILTMLSQSISNSVAISAADRMRFIRELQIAKRSLAEAISPLEQVKQLFEVQTIRQAFERFSAQSLRVESPCAFLGARTGT